MIAALAIGSAAWMVLSVIGATGYSAVATYFKRRPATYTDWTLDLPPVPVIELPADATAEELETAVFRALFADTIRREFPQYRSAA